MQNIERRLYISGMKDGFSLGGRYISNIVIENWGLAFKCQTFKGGQLWKGQGEQIQVPAVYDSQTSTTTSAAGFLKVAVARRTSLI